MLLFLHGPDTFRSRLKLRELKNKFIREVDASGINLSVFDGTKLDLMAAENSLTSQPFMAKKRMIIFENLISTKNKSAHEKIIQLLDEKRTEDSIIVFWDEIEDEKTLRSNALYQRLRKEKYAFPFPVLTGANLQAWIHQRAKELGAAIDPAAAYSLGEITGPDLWRAESELQKLSAYRMGKTISREDVIELCGEEMEDNIYLLTDALGQKNKARALELLENQLNSGTSDIELLYKMLWQIKNLLLVKSYSEDQQDKNPTSVARALGVHSFVAQKSLHAAEHFTLGELTYLHDRLIQIEDSIKTGRADSRVLLDLFIVKT